MTSTRPPSLYVGKDRDDWRADVLIAARQYGWMVYQSAGGAGFPALTLLRGKRLVFAELKTVLGKSSPLAESWLAHLRHTTAEVYVWTPADVLEVREILREP